MDSLETHATEVDTLESQHTDQAKAMKAVPAQHAAMGQRMEYVERVLGDSADEHAAEREALKSSQHARSSRGEERGGVWGVEAGAFAACYGGAAREAVGTRWGKSSVKHAEAFARAHSELEHAHGSFPARERHCGAFVDLEKAYSNLVTEKATLAGSLASTLRRLDA